MNYFLKKLWSKIVPSASEKANHKTLPLKHQPYDSAYFFTHVPKTGGTSFIVFLDRFFPARVIFPHQLWIEIGDFSVIDKNAYHLIRGHFGGGAIDLITDKEVKYLTILRDPVKLAYSTFEFVKREKGTALHSLVVSEKMSFETFLEHPKTRHLVTNRMVHNLVYGHNHDDSIHTMNLTKASFPQFRRAMNLGMNVLDDAKRLSMSKTFIDNCIWFGILEDFNHAVRLLCYKMAWPPLGKSQKLNINKNPPVITEKAKDKALALNHLDMQLYDYAKNLFSQQVNDMYDVLGCNYDDDVDVLDAAIDLNYQKNYRLKYNLSLKNSVSYDFSEILLGNQWHRREWDALKRRYFRWSGPGKDSYLDFWVEPLNYLIVVHVSNAINATVLNELKVFVNDHKVSVNTNDQGTGRRLELKCNKSYISKSGLLRLKFQSTHVERHSAIFKSNDSRVVGIALSAVEIHQVE